MKVSSVTQRRLASGMVAVGMVVATAAAVAKPHPAVHTRPVPPQRVAAVSPAPAAAPAPATRLKDLVTKQELQERHFVTQDQLKAALAGLARKDQVYTREEMDQKFATKADLPRIEARIGPGLSIAPPAGKSP